MYPHQPGEPPRDPARPALTSRRNTLVPANAAVHALRQNQGGDTDYRPHRSADPRAARRKISPATQPTTLWRRRRYHRRRHAKPEIPIDQPKRPAGSYLGGFRTPNGTRKPSPHAAEGLAALRPQIDGSHCHVPASFGGASADF